MAVFVFILVMLTDHPLAPCPVGRVLPPPWLSKRGAKPTARHTPSSGSAGPIVWSVGCCGVLLRRLLSDGKVHTSHSDSTCARSLGVCNWGSELSARGAKGKVMVQQGPRVLRPGLASPLGLSGLLAYRSSFGFEPLSRTLKPCPVLSLCGNLRSGDGQPLGAGSL